MVKESDSNSYKYQAYVGQQINNRIRSFMNKKGIKSESGFINMAVKNFLDTNDATERLHEEIIRNNLKELNSAGK